MRLGTCCVCGACARARVCACHASVCEPASARLAAWCECSLLQGTIPHACAKFKPSPSMRARLSTVKCAGRFAWLCPCADPTVACKPQKGSRGGGRLAAAKGGEQGYRTLRQGSESPRRRRRYAHRCRRRLHVPFHSILTERRARGSADSTAGTSANPNATAHTPLDCCDGPRMPSRCCLFGSITLTHTIHRVSTSRAA